MLNSITTIQNTQNFSEYNNDQISSERIRHNKNVQFNLNCQNFTHSNIQQKIPNFQKSSHSKNLKMRKNSENSIDDPTTLHEIKNLDRWVDKILTMKGN